MSQAESRYFVREGPCNVPFVKLASLVHTERIQIESIAQKCTASAW